MKIGLAGASRSNDRLAQHARRGWRLFSEHHLPTGDHAPAVEQAVLQRLRRAGHPVFLSAAELPNGWSETFDGDVLTPYALREEIRTDRPDDTDPGW